MVTKVNCPRPECGATNYLPTMINNTVALNRGMNMRVTCATCHVDFDAAPSDGTYSTVGGRLVKVADFLAHADAATIEDLRSELSNAKDRKDSSAAEAALERMGVDGKTGRGLGSQNNRMEIWAIVAVLLVILTMVLDSRRDASAPPMTPQQIQQLIDANLDQRAEPSTMNTPSTDTPRTQPAKKVGRNQLCPCGSGLKFKRCHGAHEQVRERP